MESTCLPRRKRPSGLVLRAVALFVLVAAFCLSGEILITGPDHFSRSFSVVVVPAVLLAAAAAVAFVVCNVLPPVAPPRPRPPSRRQV